MSGQDASPDEMPRFARQAGLSHEHEELALDMLLDGLPMPPEAPPELSVLPPMLADLCGPAEPGELAGETATVTRFRSQVSPAGISPARAARAARPGRAGQPSANRRFAVYRTRVATAVAVVAVGLGSTAAAYANVLPPPMQAVAHQWFGAPASHLAPRHPAPRHPAPRHPAPRHPVPPYPTLSASAIPTHPHHAGRSAQAAGASSRHTPPARRGAGSHARVKPHVKPVHPVKAVQPGKSLHHHATGHPATGHPSSGKTVARTAHRRGHSSHPRHATKHGHATKPGRAAKPGRVSRRT